MLRLCFLSIFVGRIKILTFHIDIAYYFRHNPLTLAEAEARGLLPKTRAGEQTAASRIGLTVAANAGDNTFTLLVNGKCTAEDAYMACLIATTEEGQQLALETRAGKNGKKNSWEYVTALVRSAEQMQPADGGMLDLFGNDESFRESSEKLARYVAAVREGLKARISIFVNSSKLNRKADVAKELGVKVNTPEDATRLISRLANLDAAYERLDPDLGIPAKAEAWDGKSAVPTKLDELAAGSSFSLGGGVQFAARTGADKFAPDANGKEPVLAVNVKAMRADGSEARKNDLITDEDGNVFWGHLPELDSLKERGYEALDIILRMGAKSDGFSHIVTKHGQWIMDAMEIDDPISACKRFIASVLENVHKIQYQDNKGRSNLLLKKDPATRYFIVVVGKDRVEPKYSSIKTAFVADRADRFDTETILYEGGDALELRIPMSSFGENQRLRVASEQQGRSSDYPVAAASVPSESTLPQEGEIVKSETVEPYRKPGHVSYSVVGEPRNQMDERYIAAVKRGDMDAAQRMVNDVARMRGYMPDSEYQGSRAFNGEAPSSNAYFDTDDERYEAWENGDFEGTISLADFVRRDMDPGELEWLVTSPGAYQRANKYERESIDAIRKAKANKRGKVTIYRAVPADIKEASVRNGDWVTFSKSYAEHHISLQDWEKGRIIKQVVSIDDVWWDNNDVNEWGYDDGKEYAYRNTTHNRKLLDAVTYDKNGDIVPLSKRFDYSSPDITFSVVGEHAANWDKIKHRAFRGRDDGKLRVELDASQAKINPGISAEDIKQEAGMLLRKVDKFVEGLSDEKRELLEKYIEIYKSDFSDAEREAAIKEERRLEEANKDTLDALHSELGEMVDRMWIEAILPGVDYREVEMRTHVREYYEKNIKLDERRYLGDVLDFEALYEAYPKLRYTPVSFRRLGTGTNAQVERRNGKDYIVIHEGLLRYPEGEILRTLLHEVQHVIQGIEGFAKGANFANGTDAYMRSAGEIEARNVQLRRDWTAEERAAEPFNNTLEYPGEALVSFSIQSIMTDWSAAMDNFVQNPPVHKSAAWDADVYVCPTPAVMQMVGALPRDMVMSHHVLAKVLDANTPLGNGQTTGQMYVKEKDMGKHHLTVDELRKLPLALANPVCIAESNRKGCVEVITDMEENGVNVLVAVQLDVASGSKYINVNRIASLYGKEKIEQLVKHPMLYVNTPKAYNWMVARGLQLPTRPNLIAGFNGKILSPADLVKYKMEKSLSFALEPYTPAELAEGFLRRQSHGHRLLRRMAAYMRNQARRYRLLYPRMPKDTQAALQAIADAQALILYSLRLYIPYKFFKRRESVWQGHFLQSLNHGKQIPPAIFLFFSLPRQP